MSETALLPLGPLGDDVFLHIIRTFRSMFTINEVAEMLHISRSHVRTLCDEKLLDEHKFNGVRRVTRRSLIAYLLSTANYLPSEAGHYETVMRLLLGDLPDAMLHKMSWHCGRLLEAREHAREVQKRGPAPLVTTQPEAPQPS